MASVLTVLLLGSQLFGELVTIEASPSMSASPPFVKEGGKTILTCIKGLSSDSVKLKPPWKTLPCSDNCDWNPGCIARTTYDMLCTSSITPKVMLNITAVHADDLGNWTCVHGDSSTIDITFIDQTNGTLELETSGPENEYSFLCTSGTGRPAPEITWIIPEYKGTKRTTEVQSPNADGTGYRSSRIVIPKQGESSGSFAVSCLQYQERSGISPEIIPGSGKSITISGPRSDPPKPSICGGPVWACVWGPIIGIVVIAAIIGGIFLYKNK